MLKRIDTFGSSSIVNDELGYLKSCFLYHKHLRFVDTMNFILHLKFFLFLGGPRGLLRRMRSQLAEDGCPESQLIMGKTLLEQQGELSQSFSLMSKATADLGEDTFGTIG